MKTDSNSKLLWIARISSLIPILFLSYMIAGHLISPETGTGPNPEEWLLLVFFPGSTLVGLLIAWKKAGLGGAINVLGIVVFHILSFSQNGKWNFTGMIDITAIPGLIFIVFWILTKNKN